jgi:hypothetical protein
VLELTRGIEERKALYAELDALILELRAEGFTQADHEGQRLELVDNFAEGRNTVFRPAGVKRFEISVDTIAACEKRAARKAGAR